MATKKAKARSSKTKPFVAMDNYLSYYISSEQNMDLILLPDQEFVRKSLLKVEELMMAHNVEMMKADGLTDKKKIEPILKKCEEMEVEIDVALEIVNDLLRASRKIKDQATSEEIKQIEKSA